MLARTYSIPTHCSRSVTMISGNLNWSPRPFRTLAWQVLWSPAEAYRSIAACPPVSAGVGLLLLFVGVQASATPESFPGVHAAAAILFGVYLTIQFEALFLLVTWGLSWLVRARVTPAQLIAVTAFANLPFTAEAAFYSLSRDDWWTYQVYKGALVSATVWFSVLLVVGLREAQRSRFWKSALTALPMIGISCLNVAWTLGDAPTSPGAAHPWTSTHGKYISLRYPGERANTMGPRAADRADRLVEKVCRVLRMPLPRFRVEAYFFPDPWVHGWYVRQREHDEFSYAHGRYLTTVYRPWSEMESSLAHEIAHVVAHEELGWHVPALLSEGMATYVEEELTAQPEDRSFAPVTAGTLGALADSEVFYDMHEGMFSDSASEHYTHAGGFVRFLVETYGIRSLKDFCRSACEFLSWSESEQLNSAAEQVYGKTLMALEEEWREASRRRPEPDRSINSAGK